MVVDTEAAETIEALREENRRLRAQVSQVQVELRTWLERLAFLARELQCARDRLPGGLAS
jgi:chromosome segregation ATPase